MKTVVAALLLLPASLVAQGQLSEAQQSFWSRLEALCGKAFAGTLTEGSASDSLFRRGPLVVHVRSCTATEIRIPLHVGSDRSRTWVVTRTPDGLRLKHDHRHEDGSEDAVTQYGGDARAPGTSERQEFPADTHTAALIPAARTNVWTLEVMPGQRFAYALRREGTDRRVRLEFDLTRSVPAPPLSAPSLAEQQSGTTALLIAVHAVNDSVVWVAGANRTVLRTVNGGATWIAAQVPVPDAPNLQFRDVHALDANTAWLLSIGNGRDSRILKTTDAGATWTTQFVNEDSAAFYDCFDFWSPDRGVVTSDVVRGEMVVRVTSDGGRTWTRVPASALPAGIEGEGSFAASGTCVVTQRGGHAWIGTTKGRVVRTSDYGRSWSVSRVPLTVSDSVGAVSVAFRDARNGIAFGGFGGAASDTLMALTRDGGATWSIGVRPPLRGGVSGGAYARGHSIVVAGFTGAAWSADEGRTWTVLDTANYWGIGFAPSGTGWVVGRGGRVVRIAP